MTKEERLAKIRGEHEIIPPYMHYCACCGNMPWLLELVDKQDIQISALEREKGKEERKTMTRWVQKLAEAPCPCLEGQSAQNTTTTNCDLCHGTGALAPGLRRECPVHESTRTGHETLGDPVREYPCRAKCSGCQGRGWGLIPEAEQLGVLARTAYKLGFRVSGHGSFATHQYYTILSVKLDHLWFGEGVTPEEALAHAICQAHA